MADDLKFIVALTEHRYLGNVFIPCLAETHPSCLSISSILRPREMECSGYTFNEQEQEIVKIGAKISNSSLASRFSRKSSAKDFFTEVDPGDLQKHVIPYVEKQMFRIAAIIQSAQIPLFSKEPNYSHLYDEDQILVPDEFTCAKFEFDRQPEGTTYRLKIFQNGSEIRILNKKVVTVTNDPGILLFDHRLLIFSDLDAKKVLPFISRETVHIPRQVEKKYFQSFLTGVVARYEVKASGFGITDHRGKPDIILSLEPDLSFYPVLLLRFRYDQTEFLYNDTRKMAVHSDFSTDNYSFVRTYRDLERETEVIRFLLSLGLKEKNGSLTLPNLKLLEREQAVYMLVDWLSVHQNELKEQKIEICQKALGKTYFIGSREIKLEVRGKSDWFDVYAEVQLGEFRIPFIKLKKYILNDIREFELPDGKTVILPEEWFSRYKIMFPFAKGEGYLLNFQKHHFNLLRGRGNFINPESLESLGKLLEMPEQIASPPQLKTELRAYQMAGYRWLVALCRNSMGGCLADDMGLGKTIQTIAYLLKLTRLKKPEVSGSAGSFGQLSLFAPAEQESVQPASLIVMPTSLIHNWESEINKFAPTLKVYNHTGANRINAWNSLDPVRSFDVILTTYGTIRNDAEIFKGEEFFSLILDESQYIKNPLSKTYRAIIDLQARHRLVLTGTPVENSLSDLWAQMNFLNRGLLGGFSFFKQNFITPIENHADQEVGEKLQLLIRPFILRRTKEEVAGDLPLLMEQTIYCPMTPEQESSYEREKSLIRNTILSSIENQGIKKSSIVILQGLTRLRQLSNHPRLLFPESKDESGKFGEIIELLQNIIAENHKVLIFSSFVSHLELLQDEIESRKWKYSILTGKTRDRKTIIGQFQKEADNHIFLISLKAGGVGLNLTSADYVFILDPWWNPAVESQAVSRAHRIGQTRHVFVYRFITENSIEEKIERLKEKKNELAEKFINHNDPFIKWSESEILSLL